MRLIQSLKIPRLTEQLSPALKKIEDLKNN